MSTVIELKTPIQAHGEEVSKVTLREPTTEDIIDLGMPMLIVIGGDGKSTGIEMRQPVIAAYISRLGAIPMSSVKSLKPRDFSAVSAGVMGFFGDSEDG
jgi:phage FluMu protein gp41